MSTFLFHSIIFGPVFSRRLGHSLGINLFEAKKKICTYNCIYCECGWTHVSEGFYVDVEIFRQKLHEALIYLKDNEILPDTITFAGNGEPTLHPDFLEIVKHTVQLRDLYLPGTPIAVLTNSTQLHRTDVIKALHLIDKPIFKLDTAIQETFEEIHQPLNRYQIQDIIHNISHFNGTKIIQTLIFRGKKGQRNIDNTTAEEVEALCDAYKTIRPDFVMIYTIARGTPLQTLTALNRNEMDAIASFFKQCVPEIRIEFYV